MTQDEHIPQGDMVLYAMQAMQSHELAAVRLHLDGCADCRRALAEVNGDLALVAISVEQKPLPEGARQRFVERLAADASRPDKGFAESVVSIATKKPARRAALWIGWVAAAASLLFVFSLEHKVRDLNGQLAQQQQAAAQQAAANARAQQVLDVLTAPTAKRVLLTAAKAKPEPTGRAVYLAENGGLVFQASDLEQLAADKTYELWVIPANGQAPIPAGLFRPDASGSATVVLPQIPKGIPAKAFGVTIEKAEGSPTPTAPILLVGAVPAVGE
ncbi:MAG: anti-sigma factor [Terracidiphilus sp.]